MDVDGAFSALQLKSTRTLVLVNVRQERSMVKQPCVHCHPTGTTSGTCNYSPPHHSNVQLRQLRMRRITLNKLMNVADTISVVDDNILNFYAQTF